MTENKIGIITDEEFASKHIPPYPKPTFISFEHPIRIKTILETLKNELIFENKNVEKIIPPDINEEILELAHSKYHIDSIKKISKRGGGLIDEEVFVNLDTFSLAKKAVSGAVTAVEKVFNNEINQSIALIRPPGHHAYRNRSSGLCIFNNIAISVFYLRQKLNYSEKIAIIDIDNHFGDGLAQFFYEDPSILYISIHEFDFSQADLGFIDELGAGNGIGTNINIPVPEGLTSSEFLGIIDFIEPLIREFNPRMLIIAAGFDMYFADPIGNCLLTSDAFYSFTKKMITIASDICEGKLAIILEGGYSVIGLQYCVLAVIKALLNEKYTAPEFESHFPIHSSNQNNLKKIKNALIQMITPYWNCLKVDENK
jgi:acetoin utilization deacetylase AcuC-like enzyme